MWNQAKSELRTWLRSLEVGAEVFIREGDWQHSLTVAKVTRLTKTRVFVQARSFHRAAKYEGTLGAEVGQSASTRTPCIMPPTDALKVEYAAQRARSELDNAVYYHEQLLRGLDRSAVRELYEDAKFRAQTLKAAKALKAARARAQKLGGTKTAE